MHKTLEDHQRMNSRPHVLFFSAAEISIPSLNALKGNTSIDFVGIVTQPGRAKGRGQKISLNPIATWAETNQIPYYQAEKMDATAFDWLQNKKPDIVFVMAFGHILKKEFLDLPPLGMWNFHTSLLPKYRGASPIQTAILSGDTITGVTLMSMVEKMDAGAWLAQLPINIEACDTTATLTDKLAEASAVLLKQSLPTLLSRKYTLVEQDEHQVSFCKKFFKEHGELDFSKPAAVLERQIRAFQPWPGSYFFKDGERYIVHKAHVLPSTNNESETFYIDKNRRQLLITTSENVLSIDVLQKSGGKPLAVADFLRGNIHF